MHTAIMVMVSLKNKLSRVYGAAAYPFGAAAYTAGPAAYTVGAVTYTAGEASYTACWCSSFYAHCENKANSVRLSWSWD